MKECKPNLAESEIRKSLIEYWKNEIRKEQIKEDTLSMDPEFVLNIDKLNSGSPLDEFDHQLYKEITEPNNAQKY